MHRSLSAVGGLILAMLVAACAAPAPTPSATPTPEPTATSLTCADVAQHFDGHPWLVDGDFNNYIEHIIATDPGQRASETCELLVLSAQTGRFHSRPGGVATRPDGTTEYWLNIRPNYTGVPEAYPSRDADGKMIWDGASCAWAQKNAKYTWVTNDGASCGGTSGPEPAAGTYDEGTLRIKAD